MKSRYAEYKDSGIEWLGEIPKHWEFLLGSRIGTYSKGSGIKKDEIVDDGLPCVRYGQIYTLYNYSIQSVESFIAKDASQKSVSIQNGTILLTGSGETKEDIGKAVVYNGSEELWVGGDIIILKPEQIFSPFYLTYLINSESFRIWKSQLARGEIIVHIYSKNFAEMRFPTPPLSEQEAIVSYLDEKTSQIDSLLSLTEKKIELLKEKRTALINHAVTKGLHPDAPMKDSGIVWIGEIPRHWDCLPLRYLYRKIGSGLTPRGGSEVYVDEGVVFLRSQNVHFDGLRLEEVVKISLEVHESMLGTKVMKGDVLLNITGGSIGRCCLVKEDIEMNVNQHVCIIRVKNHLLPQFLNYFLKSSSGQLQVDLNITGGNREGLSSENIKNFIIPICNISEQEAIVSYLDEKTSQIDSLIDIEQKRMDTLKEYRQSLISEVVTGKIKVGVVAGRPPQQQ